jgi:dihydrofolate synthase/folylpolyglutamate synthase
VTPAGAGAEDGGEAALGEAEAWLLGRELFGIRPGLGRMRVLLRELGDPQAAFRAVHVVGSNGKTSTVTIAAALLERRGLRSGAYVSPHLVSFRERVHVGGRPAEAGAFAAAVARVRAAAERLEREAREAGRSGATPAIDGPVTQFEAVTAASFVVLADAGVTHAVIEAGLGGRWDATNVLPDLGPDGRPPVAVLTSVSLEHTRWLGDTVKAIAGEKAAVVHPGATLVLAHGLPAGAREVARRHAAAVGATVVEAPADPGAEIPTPGAAHYQRRNLATALAAVAAMLGPDAAGDPVAERDVAAHLVVPGRFETVEPGGEGAGGADGAAGAGGSRVIHDGAHNEAGFRALADALRADPPPRPLVLLVGVLDDKDPAGMLAAVGPLADAFVLTRPSNPRALPADELAAVAARVLPTHERHVAGDAHDGLARARRLAGPRGTVLATGSLHLVADLRRGRGAAPGARF